MQKSLNNDFVERDVRTAAGANLPVVDESNAPDEVLQLFGEFRERFQRPHVPGILTCFATHPSLLRHMMGLAETMLFSEGALGRQNKELIATFVSASNSCRYCADSHGFFLMQNGGSAEMLEAALSGLVSSTALSTSQQELLRFAAKISDEAGRLNRADVEKVRESGWTDLQIAEAIHLTALFACFNRVVSAFGLPSQELLCSINGKPEAK